MDYDIWNFFPGPRPLADEVPYDVNFNTGLTIKPYKSLTIVKGELVKRVHYADVLETPFGPSYQRPLVTELFNYVRDSSPLALAVKRRQHIHWHLAGGELDMSVSKSITKYYRTIKEKRDERTRRLSNVVGALTDMVVTQLVNHGNMPPSQAIGVGASYLKAVTPQQALYKEGDIDPLVETITTATEPWMDTDVGGQTLRDLILDELNI